MTDPAWPITTYTTPTLDYLVRELRAIYALLDDAAVKVLANVEKTQGHVLSCGACKTAGCCSQLTTISVPEGLALADALLSQPTWMDLVPRLVRVAHEDARPGVTRASRLRSGVPCALLDPTPGTNRCIAYENRPGCCRFHNAVTPPERCDYSPENEGQKIGSIDLVELEGALWEVTAAMSTDLGVPPISQAPLSLMVLACLGTLLNERGRLSDRAFVEQAAGGLPDPLTWMQDHAMDLFAEDEVNGVDDVEHAAKLV